jgi:hypothetical protein
MGLRSTHGNQCQAFVTPAQAEVDPDSREACPPRHAPRFRGGDALLSFFLRGPRVVQTSLFMSAPRSSPRRLARRVFMQTESTGCLALWVRRVQQYNGGRRHLSQCLRHPWKGRVTHLHNSRPTSSRAELLCWRVYVRYGSSLPRNVTFGLPFRLIVKLNSGRHTPGRHSGCKTRGFRTLESNLP